MSKEYRQKLASNENHIKHVTMEIVASHLKYNTDEIIEESENNLPLGEDEKPDYELMDLFHEPLKRGIEKLSSELKQRADALVKGCVCYWPDDERVYPAVDKLLNRLPLPFSSAFAREDDEGYRLEVSGTVIFRGLSADEAIEATRRYVTGITGSQGGN
jgi:hypothetical protein